MLLAVLDTWQSCTLVKCWKCFHGHISILSEEHWNELLVDGDVLQCTVHLASLLHLLSDVSLQHKQ